MGRPRKIRTPSEERAALQARRARQAERRRRLRESNIGQVREREAAARRARRADPQFREREAELRRRRRENSGVREHEARAKRLKRLQDRLIRPPQCAEAEWAKAETEFERNFIYYACNVCNRLWYKREVAPLQSSQQVILVNEFPDEDVSQFLACAPCLDSLREGKVPALSRSNRYRYFDPRVPTGLPDTPNPNRKMTMMLGMPTPEMPTQTEPLVSQIGEETHPSQRLSAEAGTEGQKVTDNQHSADPASRFGRLTYTSDTTPWIEPVVCLSEAPSFINFGPPNTEPGQTILGENRELAHNELNWDAAVQKQPGAAPVPVQSVRLVAGSRREADVKPAFASCAVPGTVRVRATESPGCTSVVGDGRDTERLDKVTVKMEPVEVLEDSASQEEEFLLPDLCFEDECVPARVKTGLVEDNG